MWPRTHKAPDDGARPRACTQVQHIRRGLRFPWAASLSRAARWIMQIHRRSGRPASWSMIASRYRAADTLFRRRGGPEGEEVVRRSRAPLLRGTQPLGYLAPRSRIVERAALSVFVNLSRETSLAGPGKFVLARPPIESYPRYPSGVTREAWSPSSWHVSAEPRLAKIREYPGKGGFTFWHWSGRDWHRYT